MRILLLSTGGSIGGEETFTRNLALTLMGKGHYVEMAVGGKIQKDDVIKNGIIVADIDVTSRNPIGIIKAAKNLTEYVNKHHIDIVHAQAIGPALMGIVAKKLFKCHTPWIWHNHGITEFSYKFVVRRLNSLDKIIANSDYVSEQLKGHGVTPSVIQRIHNGINTKEFSVSDDKVLSIKESIRTEFGIPKDSFVVIYVGRLSPEKGVEVLLNGFEKLHSKNNNIRCLIVGNGPQKNELISMIQNFTSKENVIFAGFRKDIRDLVATSNILVLPSHIETFSLTTLQAFATGTVCVCSDVGGTPEQILDKFNGRLFQDNDFNQLASILEELSSQKQEIEYLKANAKELSDSYLNIDRMALEIENLYNKLIK